MGVVNSKDEYKLLTLIHKLELFRGLEASEVVWETGTRARKYWCS